MHIMFSSMIAKYIGSMRQPTTLVDGIILCIVIIIL